MKFEYLGCRNPKSWIKINGLYQATDDIYVRLRDELDMRYTYHLFAGFRSDGGTVPWGLRWFVPSWSDDNDLINLSYAIHDYNYGSGVIHRDLADLMLRDMLMQAGLSRFRANTVCWAVNSFAESHYGTEHDANDCDLFGELKVYQELSHGKA